jgi:hypothetical protein
MQEEACKNKTTKEIKFPRTNRLSNNGTNQERHFKWCVGEERKSNANVNFLTTNSIAVISGLEMDYFFGEGLFKDGRTPLDLIKTLYPIMKEDLSVFLHTAVFNEETQPIEFLNWMLNLYEEIHHEPYWEIAEDNTIYRTFDYGHEENGRSVAMSFLPRMKSDNDKWYKFLTGMFMLLDSLGIPFWWDDDEYGYAIEITEGGIEEYKSEIKDMKGAYDTIEKEKAAIKEVRGYIRSIKDDLKMHEVVAKEIQKDIQEGEFNHSLYNEMVARTPLEKSCREFIDKALEFHHKYSNDNLMRYVHYVDSELEEGTPISPDKYCAIGWNYGDEDEIASNMSMLTQSNWQEYGSVPFRFVEEGNEDVSPSLMPYAWMELLGELQKVADNYQ